MTTKFTPLKMGPSVDLTVCKLCKFEKDKVILAFVQTVSGMPVILEVEKWKEQSKRNVFAFFLRAPLEAIFQEKPIFAKIFYVHEKQVSRFAFCLSLDLWRRNYCRRVAEMSDEIFSLLPN